MVICQSSNRKLIHLHSNQSLNIKNKRDYAISNIFFSVWFGNLIAILLILVPHASGTSTSAYYSLSDYPAPIFIINILFWHSFSSPVSYSILFLVYSNIFSKFASYFVWVKSSPKAFGLLSFFVQLMLLLEHVFLCFCFIWLWSFINLSASNVVGLKFWTQSSLQSSIIYLAN